MSVRKLTISSFASLAASVLSAIAFGFYANRTGVAVSGAASILSLAVLFHLLFRSPSDGADCITEGCRDIISSMPVPAIQLDASGNVTSINSAALALGFPVSAKGEPLDGLDEVLAGGPTGAALLPVKKEDGTTLRLLVSATPYEKNGKPAGVLLIAREDARRLEEELGAVRAEAMEAEAKYRETILELEEFALMAVRREIKMKQIREKLTELSEGGEAGARSLQ